VNEPAPPAARPTPRDEARSSSPGRAAFEVLNTSVVVTADSHNPSILHPSFLVAQGIVPDKWDLAEPPICTPAVSVVKYRNGIVFSVESGKLQVLQNTPSDPASDVVPTLVVRYIETLPHVPYTAVGVNATAWLPHASADRFLIERFLKPGPWNAEGLTLESMGVRFVYQLLGGTLRISADAGTVTKLDRPEASAGVIVAGNFSFQPSKLPAAAAVETVKRYSECVAAFLNATERVFS
jgi:hypothetical protein